MKKVLVLFTALIIVMTSYASIILVAPPKKATEIYIPVGTTGKTVSLMELSQMSVKQYQELTGHKMKLTEKVGFLLSQRELRSSINNDGTLNNKKLEKMIKKAPANTGDRHNLKLALILLGVSVALYIIAAIAGSGPIYIIASIALLAAAIFFIIYLVSMA